MPFRYNVTTSELKQLHYTVLQYTVPKPEPLRRYACESNGGFLYTCLPRLCSTGVHIFSIPATSV
jgi:hypothetical protein